VIPRSFLILALLPLAACQPDVADVLFGDPPPQAQSLRSETDVRSADGAIELHFTRPGVDAASGEDPELDDAVAELFDMAEDRIDLCLFEFDRAVIVEALLEAHEAGVEIRFVGDGDEAEDEGYEELVEAGVDLSLRQPRDRIMHNKFAVVDETWVWTGSTNFSEHGVLRNNNGSIRVESELLASYYTDEFEQMYVDGLFGRHKVPFDHAAPVLLADEELEVHFSPADPPHEELLAALDQADESVLFMIFAFTREDVTNKLIELHESGVMVVGVFDESQARGRYSVDERLAKAGVPVFIDGNNHTIGFGGGKLHHKVLLVDAMSDSDPTVAIGSYNWSASASRYNDENLLVIRGPETTAAYLEEFCGILDDATQHPDYEGRLPDPCASLLQQIRVNEVMANPAGSDSGEEWVELVNAGAAPVELEGWTLGDASRVRHTFAPVVLGPAEALLVRSGADAAFPSAVIADSGNLGLANNSDEVVLRDGSGRIVDRVGYTSAVSGVSFNRDPDGAAAGPFVLHDDLSGAAGDSSPGLRADGSPWGGRVIVNEALPNPAGTDSGNEWVELLNVGLAPADLSGWTFGDASDDERHVFEAGTVLAPGEALVLFDSGSHPDVPGSIVSSSGSLSLNNSAETLTLHDADGALRDEVGWSGSSEDVSLNRAIDGDPDSPLIDHDDVPGATADHSPGAQVDGSPWGGRVMINELMPNPDGSDSGEEWVELVNTGDFDVDLDGWTLRDSVGERHVFGGGPTLAPGEALVIFDSGIHSEVPGSITSSTGSLSLNNGGDAFELLDPDGAVRSAVSWTGCSSGVSLNRAEDAASDAPLVDHDEVPGATADSSPGTRVDGSAW